MTLQEQTIMRNRPIVLCQVSIVIRSDPRKEKTAFLKLFQFPLKLERIQLCDLAADQFASDLKSGRGQRLIASASITSTAAAITTTAVASAIDGVSHGI